MATVLISRPYRYGDREGISHTAVIDGIPYKLGKDVDLTKIDPDYSFLEDTFYDREKKAVTSRTYTFNEEVK